MKPNFYKHILLFNLDDLIPGETIAPELNKRIIRKAVKNSSSPNIPILHYEKGIIGIVNKMYLIGNSVYMDAVCWRVDEKEMRFAEFGFSFQNIRNPKIMEIYLKRNND